MHRLLIAISCILSSTAPLMAQSTAARIPPSAQYDQSMGLYRPEGGRRHVAYTLMDHVGSSQLAVLDAGSDKFRTILMNADRATAQTVRSHARFWGAIGMIGAASHEEHRIGALLQLAFQKPPHHFTVRHVWLEKDFGGGEVITELGGTYGRTVTAGWGHAALHGGIVVLGFQDCPGSDSGHCNAVGIPIVAEAALSARVIGLGLQAHGNVNPKEMYAGLAFVVYVGWMP